jgi:hypothetical protein
MVKLLWVLNWRYAYQQTKIRRYKSQLHKHYALRKIMVA